MYKKKELVKMGGCEGCTRQCCFNAPVAFPEVAERTKNIKYCCNNSRKDYNKRRYNE